MSEQDEGAALPNHNVKPVPAAAGNLTIEDAVKAVTPSAAPTTPPPATTPPPEPVVDVLDLDGDGESDADSDEGDE